MCGAANEQGWRNKSTMEPLPVFPKLNIRGLEVTSIQLGQFLSIHTRNIEYQEIV